MCGRFTLNEQPAKLAKHFDLSGKLDLSPSWNIAPSSNICVITADAQGERHLLHMKWGLIPSWAKDATIGHKLANARGETVAEKPSFRSAFRARRCIVPASGFYEWQLVQGKKQPWYISFKSGEPMAFAGLWETWHASDKETVTSCCLITTSANALMEPIHDRMPVILDHNEWQQWLSQEVRDTNTLLPLIRPHDAETMQAWPVSREVNRVGLRDDVGLTERVAM